MHIQTLDPAGPTYQPGVCNIGPGEIARRRRLGIAGIVVTIVVAIALVAVGAPPVGRALVVLPLWGSLVTLEQARRHFCVAFAYEGIRSAEGSEDREAVGDPSDAARDRSAARWMVAYCGAIAAVVTAVFVIVTP